MTEAWTIYNNTTPWGLLTEEQQLAYNSHGGDFQYWPDKITGWVFVEPRWDDDCVYRAVKPKVKVKHTRWVVIWLDGVTWWCDKEPDPSTNNDCKIIKVEAEFEQ